MSLFGLIDELNADPRVHGILVQLPLPQHIQRTAVIERIDPAKDVMAFTPTTSAASRSAFRACVRAHPTA